MGNQERAPAHLDRLLGFLKQDPGNQSLRIEVFEAALAAGDFDEARHQVDQAKEAEAMDTAWMNREARLFLAQGHFRQAREALDRLMAAIGEDPALRYNLAYALFGEGSHQEASGVVAPLLEGGQELGSLAWALWLRCQHHHRRLLEGLEAFEAASANRVFSPEVYGVASLMAFDAERQDEAKRWSGMALRADPRQHEALVVQGSLSLGRAEAALARDLFERALEIHGNDGRSWSGLAFARMLGMDLPGAKAAFTTALESMPTHIGTWIGLGWCQLLLGDPAASRRAFEEALALDRNFGESHGGLAAALARQGEGERAKTEVEIALKLDPKNLSARYAQAVLSGEAKDPAAFRRLAQRLLSQHTLATDGKMSLADVVLRFRP